MREKAKELQRQRVEATKRGIKSPVAAGGFGPSPMASSVPSMPTEMPKPSYTPAVMYDKIQYLIRFFLDTRMQILVWFGCFFGL